MIDPDDRVLALIATARLAEAGTTLQLLGNSVHDRVCVVEGTAAKAVLSPDLRATLAAQAAEHREFADRIERALAAALPVVTPDQRAA